jgi:hypothetical protein
MAIRETVTVQTDFGSFYLRVPVRDFRQPPEGERQAAFLIDRRDLATFLVHVPAQAPLIDVEVLVHERAPESPEPEWGDVAEISATIRPEGLQLAGWEREPSHRIPLAMEGAHRIRYSIAGADLVASNPTTDPCRYRLEFWPQPVGAARLVRLQSAFMRGRLATWRNPATGIHGTYPVEVPPLEL